MNIARMVRVTRVSFKNLSQYKLRAFLTTLGIIFGVCSVVAMLSVGEGASQEIQEQFKKMGSDNILISSVKLPDEQFSGGATQSSGFVSMFGLKYDDADRFSRMVPHLKALTPLKELSDSVRYSDRMMETTIRATVPWYPNVTNHRMLAGRFISEEDMNNRAAICVIGARMARTLFAATDPMGKIVRIGDGDTYKVIGVIGDAFSTEKFENKPLWFMGENQDIFVPLTTWRSLKGDLHVKMGGGDNNAQMVELHQVVLTIDSQDNVMYASDIVHKLLGQHHRREDYSIVVPLQLIRQRQQTARVMNIVLGSIAAISLVVGGIGIMNIMLATVSERTREIGIRRALGAHRRDIVFQFLVETLMLSVSGGVIGMVIGAAIPKFLTYMTNMATVLTPESFMIAFGVSVAVGLIFGIYPARRAALMDPIEALRHE